MNTKQIVIECWFLESEDFIKENVGSLDINYKLINDWRRSIGLSAIPEFWTLTGDDKDIDALVRSLEDKDYDITIMTPDEYHKFFHRE